MTPETLAPQAAPARTAKPARKERRNADRVKVTGLWCDRGQVLDFSPRGMRLTTLRRWPEGMTRKLTIHVEGRAYEVQARCIWCRQDAIFTHTAGLAFDNLTPETAAALQAVVHSAM